MSDLESVFSTLFTAPTKAVVEAEAQYRKIWIVWLRDLQELVTARKSLKDSKGAVVPLLQEDEESLIKTQMGLSPVMRLGGTIEVAVTMRLASVTKMEGSLSMGLSAGAFQAAGSFGFSSQTSQESVLQARAMYGITNARETSLEKYLKDFSVPVTDSASLGEAVKFLTTNTVPTTAK